MQQRGCGCPSKDCENTPCSHIIVVKDSGLGHLGRLTSRKGHKFGRCCHHLHTPIVIRVTTRHRMLCRGFLRRLGCTHPFARLQHTPPSPSSSQISSVSSHALRHLLGPVAAFVISRSGCDSRSSGRSRIRPSVFHSASGYLDVFFEQLKTRRVDSVSVRCSPSACSSRSSSRRDFYILTCATVFAVCVCV